jgi:hypothetical protein
MSVKRPLLEVGFDKYGGFDFGVTCTITELSGEQMDRFRAMVVAAIGTMEEMWRREQCQNASRGDYDG